MATSATGVGWKVGTMVILIEDLKDCFVKNGLTAIITELTN